MLENLVTEQPNPSSSHLDTANTQELLTIINREDQAVAAAVRAEIPVIGQAVDAIVERYRRGGRLIYVGAGTSGRLGVLDASECPPTFGIAEDRVQGIIAGGPEALIRSLEGREDDPYAAVSELKSRVLQERDAIVGISASGRTPFVLGALEHARQVRALTVGLSTNPGSDLEPLCDITVCPLVGPEVITGSTRMKSGTAQKLVLNMLSTAVMVKMGYVLDNLMVNLQLKSEKLVARAQRIVARAAGCTSEEALEALKASHHRVRTAIVMARFGLPAEEANRRLADAGDHLRTALLSGHA